MIGQASARDGIVVVGGGLAGLAAGYYSGAPVYEASDAPGGVAGSDLVSGFTFDRGIHILQTRNQTVLDLLCDIGVELREFSRNAYIYAYGKYTPYPFQVNTSGLPVAMRARCVWGFMRRGRYPEPQNYEQWIYRSVGKEFAERFLIPYSEKFWTIHPSEMAWEWAGSRVPQPKLGQVLRGAVWARHTRIGTNADFRYPCNAAGYGAVAAALARRIDHLHLRHRATHVDTVARRVSFENERSVPYETLISTMPLPELIKICSNVPAGVREAVSRLWTNSIFVVNLGISRRNISDRHWVHFPEKDVVFFRISYPHSFGSGVVPDGMSSISAEIAYSARRPLDKTTAVERTIEDLRRVGAMGKDDKVAVTATRDIPYAYCVYDHARKDALSEIRIWLKSVGIEPAGRYGLWTYFWSDEAIMSARKVAERVIGREPVCAAQAG